MSQQYQKALDRYNEAKAKSKQGDKTAFADKAKIMGDIRQMERESARAGVVLDRRERDGRVVAVATTAPAKRSIQEEYVRKFDNKHEVRIENKNGPAFQGTLQDFHAKRLLGK